MLLDDNSETRRINNNAINECVKYIVDEKLREEVRKRLTKKCCKEQGCDKTSTTVIGYCDNHDPRPPTNHIACVPFPYNVRRG